MADLFDLRKQEIKKRLQEAFAGKDVRVHHLGDGGNLLKEEFYMWDAGTQSHKSVEWEDFVREFHDIGDDREQRKIALGEAIFYQEACDLLRLDSKEITKAAMEGLRKK